MTKSLKVGDHVEWNTSQGKTRGKIKKKLTSAIEIKGHHVAATEEDPQWLVETDESGEEAAHKPDALTKVRG